MQTLAPIAVALVLGLAASPARAKSPPSSEKFVEALLAPDAKIPDVVDLSRGVFFADWPSKDMLRGGRMARNLCGRELRSRLPVLLTTLARELLAIQIRGGTFVCRHRRCHFHFARAANRSATIYELHFEVIAGRPVLAAILQPGEVGLAGAEKVRRRRWALAQLSRAQPRSCPAVKTKTPTGASPELLRELATGLRPLASVIDPKRGLLRARYPDNSGRLCGARLARALPALRRQLAHLVRGAEAGLFECKKQECVLTKLVDANSTVHYLRFHRGPSGRVSLHSWIELDEALTSASFKATQRRWAARVVRRARCSR